PPNALGPEGTAEAPVRSRRSGKSKAGTAKEEEEGTRKASGRSESGPSLRSNSIRPARAPQRVGQAAKGPDADVAGDRRESDPPRTRQGSERAAEGVPSAASASLRNGADSSSVPQAVRDRFIQDGRRYYFPDGAPAFKDLGKRLTTQSENTEVVHSLIEIADARGWSEITVSGTERFRREAWRQARLAGLEVRGYKPTSVEQAQLIRALAGRAQGQQSELHLVSEPEAPGDASRASSPAAEAPSSAARSA